MLVFPLEVDERLDRMELPFDEHGIDPYGISKKHLSVFFSTLGALYKYYFSVKTFGAEHIPKSGRAMLVGNHSGGIALDGAMTIASAFFDLEPPRLAQGMVEKFMVRLPFFSSWTSRTGNFVGLPEHALRLLEDERLLLVFPEGSRGTAKLYKERYSLVDFGTGFMRLALAAKAPIVPFAFVGGGDAVPTVLNAYRVGKLLGVPYVPLTPYLVPFPLPVKLEIHYGAPLHFSGTGTEDDEVVLRYVGEVRDSIHTMLERARHKERV